MTEWFHVTNTGDQNLILGLPWLTKRNPIINWRGKSLEIRTSTGDSNWRESEVMVLHLGLASAYTRTRTLSRRHSRYIPRYIPCTFGHTSDQNTSWTSLHNGIR